jgi:AcrR family transcriptional regulator
MSSNSKSKKEDPRITRTRGLILESFDQLLREKGFGTLTVQDVTNQAQINRATFYAHFQDKYALLDYALSARFRMEIENRTLDVCQYSPENLKTLILVVVEFQSEMHSGCAHPDQQFESLAEGTLKKQIFGLLTHWLEQSKTKLSTDIPATVATWAIYGLANHYSHLKKRPALDKFVDEALPLVAVNLEQFA